MIDAVEAVRSAFPGRAVDLEGVGQLSSAWRVDNDLIVRVPHHPFGIERLRFEVRLLGSIRHRLGVMVPDIVEVALDRPVGRAYVAHRRIPGRVLGRDDVLALPLARVETIGRQVGRFLRELHSINTADVPGVPARTAVEFAADLRAEVDNLLAPLISARQLAALHRDLARLDALPSQPSVLAHTDIGGNVVVDEHDTVGVIDFGSCFVTHPAFDTASLSVLGEPLLRAAAIEYPLLGQLQTEADAVTGSFFLQDALYGARQQDWPYVRAMFGASD